MLASVILDLAESPRTTAACFASANYKDFDDPSVLQPLAAVGCKYFRAFQPTLNYIQSLFQRSSPT